MIEFNPYNRSFVADPYAVYAQLREHAPVYYNADLRFWALSRYADVTAAHADARTYSSAAGVTIDGLEAAWPFLIVKDQPDHGIAKGLVVKLFSRPRMAALDIFIRKRVVELLEGAYERYGPAGEFNLVDEFSVELPLSVISELLGIPEEMRDETHELSNRIAHRGGDDGSEVERAMLRMLELYTRLGADRRANPRDDIISMLIAQEVEDDDGNKHRMDDAELGARFMEMGFAGHETVSGAIPNSVIALDAFPDERRQLTADRSLLPNAVEELLRYDPPSQLQGRTTTRDVQLHGVTIPAGERVMLLTGSATRDPRAFDDPDRLDIDRKLDTRSVFFGFGVHKCLGIHLARREVLIAFDELLSRFPDYEVDPSRVSRAVTNGVRSALGLPIRLGAHA